MNKSDKPLQILLLEDNPADVELLRRQLKKGQLAFDLHVADTRREFIAELNMHPPDIVLSDHSLLSFNSLDALRIVREKGFDVPFILVTGTVSEDFAVQCMKDGADDYILKNNLTRLPAAIRNCLYSKELSREKKMIESLHEELKSAYSEIEQMNKDMTDSISYARHIQDAILPQKMLLEKHLADAIIVYKPKDIISGDFYWFNVVDGKLVVAVADCTGHGVPGALMSVLGHNLLNEIVCMEKNTVPGEILAKLNADIRRLLRQDTGAHVSQDGMDITVCAIDLDGGTLSFAGANHHLFFFHGKKLSLVKGDRKGIGGFQREAYRTYTNHELKYVTGDTVYMFSDGYADQFGGRKEKRMQTRNLVKLLESTLALGLREQEVLLDDWLKRWKGRLKQTDDILLIGMRLP